MAEQPRAFPSTAIDDRFGGMTLHEYYAGQALTGTIMDQASWGVDHSKSAADFARIAHDIADAMMAEREKRRG